MCLHELYIKDSTDAEDYPDIHKMAILADVAPYSREYNTFRQIVGKEAQNNTELEIEYEKILKRVKQTCESVIKMTDRHFTAPVEEISGTVEEVTPGGVTLKQFPGRRFQFSSVSTSAADMSARILGEHQVFPSCRTPKPSRGRDRPGPHLAPHPRPSPLPGSLFLYIRMGSICSSCLTQERDPSSRSGGSSLARSSLIMWSFDRRRLRKPPLPWRSDECLSGHQNSRFRLLIGGAIWGGVFPHRTRGNIRFPTSNLHFSL
jgi:hypothetical protein